MRAWGLQLFGDIVHGASNDAQMTWLFERLDLAVYLTIAWTAGSATGRDFACRLRSTSKADVTEPVHPSIVNQGR